jgi:hypothetical protein
MNKKWVHKSLKILAILLVIALFGASLNIIAVKTNEGKMPVLTYQYVSSNTHFDFTEKEKINNYPLTDILKIETKNYIHYFSIGDIFLYLSIIPIGIFLTKDTLSWGYRKIKKRWREDYGFKVHN